MKVPIVADFNSYSTTACLSVFTTSVVAAAVWVTDNTVVLRKYQSIVVAEAIVAIAIEDKVAVDCFKTHHRALLIEA